MIGLSRREAKYLVRLPIYVVQPENYISQVVADDPQEQDKLPQVLYTLHRLSSAKTVVTAKSLDLQWMSRKLLPEQLLRLPVLFQLRDPRL